MDSVKVSSYLDSYIFLRLWLWGQFVIRRMKLFLLCAYSPDSEVRRFILVPSKLLPAVQNYYFAFYGFHFNNFFYYYLQFTFYPSSNFFYYPWEFISIFFLLIRFYFTSLVRDKNPVFYLFIFLLQLFIKCNCERIQTAQTWRDESNGKTKQTHEYTQQCSIDEWPLEATKRKNP
jgi:hypothetical protein